MPKEYEAMNKFGIEVECAVDHDYYEDQVHPNTFDVTGDPSLNSSEGYCREYVSHPLTADEETISSFADDVQALYDFGITDINSSMGLHIHVSVQDDYHPGLLKTYRFYEFFMQHLENSDLYESSEPLRLRMEGVRHSEPFSGEDEFASHSAPDGSSGRYRHINYNALRRHGTIEFRVFPALQQADYVMEAIGITLTACNQWLINNNWEVSSSFSGEVTEQEERVLTV